MRQQKKYNTFKSHSGNKSLKFRNFLMSLQSPFKWLSRNLAYSAILAVVLIIVLGIFTYLVYYFYIPGNTEFASCPSLFVKIKEKPSYGVFVDNEGTGIGAIHIIGRKDDGSLASITMQKDEWVRVYFSDNFPYSQVSELMRLSAIETGKTNYCWFAEQLSLLTGVPLEFIVFRTSGIPVVSTLRFSDYIQLAGQYGGTNTNRLKSDQIPLQVLPDLSKVPVITFTAFREQYPNLFKIQEATNEQAFVEVYNSSPISGYASLVAHKLTMLGIEVSRVGNAAYETENDADAILFIRSSEQYQKTVQLVISSLPSGGIVDIQIGRPEGIVTTGDIVVILLKR